MPDEIAGEFEDGHLVVPLDISTNQDQTATAYLVLPTAIAAIYLDSTADDPADQEQQTIVIASTVLGQVFQAVNTGVFAASPSGLVLSQDDVAANTMPEILAKMDEPALVLTATLQSGSSILPFSLVLPGTFLDIMAGALPANLAAAAGTGPQAAVSDPLVLDLPFSLTEDELDAAEVLDEIPARPTPLFSPTPEPVPVFASQPEPQPQAAPFLQPFAEPQAQPLPQREPTPIGAFAGVGAPAAHRAMFAPLPEVEPAPTFHAMDLLAGLQMNVTVELGRTELTVSEVLGLGAGSVIELDRLAGEPVDILVNDRIIARGEVVVVDENFGVRVVEVVRRGGETEERAS
jgi:flagellar motor switch protein FliN